MNLEQDFPDLSQSIVVEVLKNCSNNKEEAAKTLRAFSDTQNEEKEKKINEMQQQFIDLPREEIVKVLQSANYDLEAALVPLFNKYEEFQKNKKKAKSIEEQKKKEIEENKKKEIEAKNRAKGLMEMFKSIPKKKVQEVLDSNDGDIEETTSELLRLVAEQEAKEAEKKEKKKQIFNEKQTQEIKINALKTKFEDFSEEEIIKQLKDSNWDIKAACLKCEQIAASKKIDELKVFFPSLQHSDIQAALHTRNWDKARAAEDLVYLVEKRRQEQVQKEADAKQAQEKQKQEKEALKKAQEKKEPQKLIPQVQENILERSLILAAEMEKQIQADKEKEDLKEKKDLSEQKKRAEALLREDLSHIIATQARLGLSPGVQAPPLPKQIDQILKKKPVEEEIAKEIPQTLEAPKIISSSSSVQSSNSVSLSASPSMVDSGQTITVEYEILEGKSSNWDWIGMYLPSKPNKQYETYQYRGRAEKKGLVEFTAPSQFGEYEFRYFGGSYEHSVISNRIIVGPQIQLKATHDQEMNKFCVSWEQKSGNSYPSAWIGFYEKGEQNNTKYITWEYANSPNNELYFDVPIKPTEYEFRYFPTKYIPVALSNPLTITGEDKLVSSLASDIITVKPNIVSVDPSQDSVWVGLYEISEKDNRQWRRYKYIEDRTLPIHFKRPKRGGNFEFRLFAKGNYDSIVKSGSFVLE